MVNKPLKFHFLVKGWQATLCGRPLASVSRTTADGARVNCKVCLEDPFLSSLARTDQNNPPPPKVRRDGTTLTLDFFTEALAVQFMDWLDSEDEWPHFGNWVDSQ